MISFSSFGFSRFFGSPIGVFDMIIALQHKKNNRGKKFSVLVYPDEKEEICVAFTEKKNGKYAYIYCSTFTADEITDDFGLTAFDIYRRCDAVFGIMPDGHGSVVVNGSVPSETVKFSFSGKKFKLWYASVDGGFDAVEKIEYSK